MSLDPRLLELLVDPEDKGPLIYRDDKGLLYNERTRRAYEVKNNIPVLLVDDSRIVSDEEHAELIKDMK